LTSNSAVEPYTTVTKFNGIKTFESRSAKELEVTVTSASLDTVAKAYYGDSSPGAVTRYGTISTMTFAGASGSRDAIETKLVFDAPLIADQFYLTPGQSVTETGTHTTTSISTTSGIVSAPRITNSKNKRSVQFVGIESVTIPAGTFNACKFLDTTAGLAISPATWVLVGYGATIKETSPAYAGAYVATSILIDGLALH
jgi:hypothetical protein